MIKFSFSPTLRLSMIFILSIYNLSQEHLLYLPLKLLLWEAAQFIPFMKLSENIFAWKWPYFYNDVNLSKSKITSITTSIGDIRTSQSETEKTLNICSILYYTSTKPCQKATGSEASKRNGSIIWRNRRELNWKEGGKGTCLTESAISGPIPSPGKRVARIGVEAEEKALGFVR